MAKRILAVSSHPRNSSLRDSSALKAKLSEKCVFLDSFDPLSFPELGTLVGLAFTAVLAEGRLVDDCPASVG